jgi:hypothetical protein
MIADLCWAALIAVALFNTTKVLFGAKAPTNGQTLLASAAWAVLIVYYFN